MLTLQHRLILLARVAAMFASSAGSAALAALRLGSLAPRFARVGGAHATAFGRFFPCPPGAVVISVDKESGARTKCAHALPLAGAIAVAYMYGIESRNVRAYCQPPDAPVQSNGGGNDGGARSGDIVAAASIMMPLPPLGDTGGTTSAAAAAAAAAPASDAASDAAPGVTSSVEDASTADAQLSASKKRYYIVI